MSSTAPLTLFSFDYPPLNGGVARLCAGIADSLGERGISVAVLSQRRGKNGAGSDVPRVPEVRLTGRRPGREAAALLTLLRRKGLVLCGLWYPEGFVARLAGRPYVVLAHGAELLPPAGPRRRIWGMLQRDVLGHARLVVANSQFTAKLVREVAPGATVSAIPLAVDHERFSPGDRQAARERLGLPEGLIVSTVARVLAFKGHDVVLRAIAALPEDQRRTWTYVVAGRGPHVPKLRQLAADLGLESVRFLDFVLEEDLPHLYRASDLFALCTRKEPENRAVEGFGLALLEAQACAVPVTATRIGGIPDAVQEGRGGWLIEQDDIAALTDILQLVAQNPDLAHEQGLAARHRVEEGFTWGQYAARLSAALRSHGINVD